MIKVNTLIIYLFTLVMMPSAWSNHMITLNGVAGGIGSDCNELLSWDTVRRSYENGMSPYQNSACAMATGDITSRVTTVTLSTCANVGDSAYYNMILNCSVSLRCEASTGNEINQLFVMTTFPTSQSCLADPQFSEATICQSIKNQFPSHSDYKITFNGHEVKRGICPQTTVKISCPARNEVVSTLAIPKVTTGFKNRAVAPVIQNWDFKNAVIQGNEISCVYQLGNNGPKTDFIYATAIGSGTLTGYVASKCSFAGAVITCVK